MGQTGTTKDNLQDNRTEIDEAEDEEDDVKPPTIKVNGLTKYIIIERSLVT